MKKLINFAKSNIEISFLIVYFILFIAGSIHYVQTGQKWSGYALSAICMTAMGLWVYKKFIQKKKKK